MIIKIRKSGVCREHNYFWKKCLWTLHKAPLPKITGNIHNVFFVYFWPHLHMYPNFKNTQKIQMYISCNTYHFYICMSTEEIHSIIHMYYRSNTWQKYICTRPVKIQHKYICIPKSVLLGLLWINDLTHLPGAILKSTQSKDNNLQLIS